MNQHEIWQLIDSRGFGGIESHVFQIANYLTKRGIDNRVIFLKNYHQPHPLEPQLINSNIFFSYHDGQFLSFIKLIKKYNPKIIHSHGYKANLFCKLAKLFIPLANIASYHAEQSIGRVKFYNYLDENLSFMSNNIAVSDRIKNRLNQKATIQLNNFIDINDITLEPNKGSHSIAFVGRLSNEKGPDIFCELAALLPNYSFHIYGDGPLFNTLENKYGEQITFHGKKSNMDEYWKNIDLLCMPSRSEGLPLTALEAMSRGITIFAASVGNLPKLISHKHNGYLFHNNSPEIITELIQQYEALGATEKILLSEQARQTVLEQYSSQSQMPKLLSIYKKTVAPSKK